jgi:formylglycine-generating enzyme required for sulfatase activity
MGVPDFDLDCDGYRLPTEAEWEYAYRAGTRSAYYNGDNAPTSSTECWNDAALDEIAIYCDNSLNQPTVGGSKAPNAWGLYDMAGNAFEWVWDGYASIPARPAIDPTGPSDWTPYRILRGGGFIWSPEKMRAASRTFFNNFRGTTSGFRLARTQPDG